MPHSAYGYTDMIERTGEEFITSVWLWQAYRELADAIEPRNPEWAADCRQRAEQIQRGLEGLYDAESGLYFATSGVGRQPDVWGSALAVSNGAAGERALGIAEALAGMYDRIV